MAIKNIILDLGGVLLNIDYHKTIDAFKSLGIENFDSIFTQAKQEKLFDLYESGQMHSDKFIEELKSKLPGDITSQEIIDAWNAMLLDFPEERLKYLLELKKKYNTVLLSNTNPIHLEAFHKIIKDNNNLDSLDAHFNKVYFSSDMKMRKPSPNIFTRVCEEQGFKPEETLFIDDTLQHVEGAKAAGLQAHHLNLPEQDIIGLLGTLLT
ncbi:MAG: HAD family phosphatase [Brumimicrobium sp.]|nr:HAD family phosphatase [Brumimicrobium sp.]